MNVKFLFNKEVSEIERNGSNPEWVEKKFKTYKKTVESAGKSLGIPKPFNQFQKTLRKRRWTLKSIYDLVKVFLREGFDSFLQHLGIQRKQQKQAFIGAALTGTFAMMFVLGFVGMLTIEALTDGLIGSLISSNQKHNHLSQTAEPKVKLFLQNIPNAESVSRLNRDQINESIKYIKNNFYHLGKLLDLIEKKYPQVITIEESLKFEKMKRLVERFLRNYPGTEKLLKLYPYRKKWKSLQKTVSNYIKDPVVGEKISQHYPKLVQIVNEIDQVIDKRLYEKG